MGIVKVHITNEIKMGQNGFVRKSKLDSGINMGQLNKDFEASDKKIMFYLKPGCPPCIQLYSYLRPLVQSLKGKLVKDNEDVLIAALYHDPMNESNNDVNGLTSLAGDLNSIIKHYPMIYLYDNHGPDYEFDGDRSKEPLKEYMVKTLGIIVDKNVGKINEGSKRKRKPIKKRKSRNRKRKISKRWNKIKKYTRKMSIMRKLKRMKKKRGKKKGKKRKKKTSKIKSKARKIMKAFTRKLMNL